MLAVFLQIIPCGPLLGAVRIFGAANCGYRFNDPWGGALPPQDPLKRATIGPACPSLKGSTVATPWGSSYRAPFVGRAFRIKCAALVRYSGPRRVPLIAVLALTTFSGYLLGIRWFPKRERSHGSLFLPPLP